MKPSFGNKTYFAIQYLKIVNTITVKVNSVMGLSKSPIVMLKPLFLLMPVVYNYNTIYDWDCRKHILCMMLITKCDRYAAVAGLQDRWYDFYPIHTKGIICDLLSENCHFCTFLKFFLIVYLLSRVKRSRLLKFQLLMMNNPGATALDSWNC